MPPCKERGGYKVQPAAGPPLSKNNVLNNWCDKVGRDPNEIKRSIGIDIKRIDLADDLLEAGATEITLAVNGPGYDLTQVKEWIAWRDSK